MKQDWARCTWGNQNPYYGRDNLLLFQDFSSETQLVIIYNLLNPTLEALYKPLHLLKGIVVTDEYWHDMMSVTSEGFDGKTPHDGEPSVVSQPVPECEAEIATEPLPPKPRRIVTTCSTRWTSLDAKAVARDLVCDGTARSP